jgi:hypothetical protein
LPFSKEPTTGPYFGPVDCTPHPDTILRSILILSCCQRNGLPAWDLHAFLTFPIRMSCYAFLPCGTPWFDHTSIV